MKRVLTIAGSDCSGGAGIQADMKTITVHKMYAMSAITALTAQNTTGVYGILAVEPDFLANQLDCIFSDIMPDAVKIGMVASAELIKVIAQKLKEHNAKNIVLDPVMVATSGSKLIDDNAKDALVNLLFPLADVITPNIHEAEILCDFSIKSEDDMILAAKNLWEKYNVSALIKGGHLGEDARDYIFDGTNGHWFSSKRIDNPNTHGTGCTLSSAIACNLAANNSLKDSISNAKEYLTGAIADKLDLGKGSGPLNHMYKL